MGLIADHIDKLRPLDVRLVAHSLSCILVLILRFKQGWVLLVPEEHLLMRLVAALITSMVFTCVLLVIRRCIKTIAVAALKNA